MRVAGRWVLILFGSFAIVAWAELEENHVPSLSIEPSLEEVPANHLKFYLHFSEPMERGEVFRFLRLVEIDREGDTVREIAEPFREVELWDETFTRMTLWFHPGRQKLGINLNVEIGPVLEDGKRYRLEISPDWKTERGSALGGVLGFEFRAGEVDKIQPDPRAWGYGYSFGGNGGRILIHTDGAMDPVSARKRIQMLRGDEVVPFEVRGNRLAVSLGKEKGEELYVIVDPRLEDLAGNSVARPFNLDLEANPEFEEVTKPVEVVFPRKVVIPKGIAFP